MNWLHVSENDSIKLTLTVGAIASVIAFLLLKDNLKETFKKRTKK